MSAKTPSILVTDSRAQNQRKSPFPSSNVSPSPDVRDISLDTLLAGVDQVPSARRRIPLPNQSGKSRLQGQNVPQRFEIGLGFAYRRMSKITQKLVLLPEHETLERPFDSDEDRPPHDYRLPSRSIAERLTKERREERSLPRVTAYCVSEAFRFQSTASFLRTKHDVVSRIYDEALYAAYHLPLLPGISGNRVKSSPEAKSSCGKYMDLQDDYEFTDTLITEGEISGMMQHAEMFVFSYGVVCFWNFSERQERNILADLTFALAGSLLVRPLLDKDVQTEDLHFEYSPTTQRPRIYNDMITLRSADHMIKLAMSHAIAQSVKMTVFEERMELTLQDTRHVPKELALTGELDMQRSQVLKMSGKLFKLRVDVNLSSNVLGAYTPGLTNPRHTRLLLGLGTNAAPALHRRQRYPLFPPI
ncbi:Sad1-interacting factor 3 [Neolecta irregularis DAH-3]|uniref:Sad1-interacting factor 3 n=1 Tax=Neolecta irregularis (strain DAH-3) TaxID=1198029 RepID=A0A1U7LPU4_NEOID|nr:Sad1-interacting factor 3 [Neolecta irregularis DAH-3]|eukprot:OLL24541.1 Sad1-interacting factor 3 [Neolecta irregularis DAH-3]